MIDPASKNLAISEINGLLVFLRNYSPLSEKVMCELAKENSSTLYKIWAALQTLSLKV